MATRRQALPPCPCGKNPAVNVRRISEDCMGATVSCSCGLTTDEVDAVWGSSAADLARAEWCDMVKERLFE